jgi:hypothetical protein
MVSNTPVTTRSLNKFSVIVGAGVCTGCKTAQGEAGSNTAWRVRLAWGKARGAASGRGVSRKSCAASTLAGEPPNQSANSSQAMLRFSRLQALVQTKEKTSPSSGKNAFM